MGRLSRRNTRTVKQFPSFLKNTSDIKCSNVYKSKILCKAIDPETDSQISLL